MKFEHHGDRITVSGTRGQLVVSSCDETAWKFLMLIEGECGADTRVAVARRYGFCKQRYYQLRHAYREDGAEALGSSKRGPKRNYRREGEPTRQIIRYRYLDPDASAEVIGQKMRQDGFEISNRSVYRVFEEFGLQKKGSTNMDRERRKTPRS